MEHRTKSGLYIYQPYGSVSHPDHVAAGRLWGIGDLHNLARIDGLTKHEAERVLDALQPSQVRETALERWVDGEISAGKLAELLGVSRQAVRPIEYLMELKQA